ncbi:MAG: LysM peptidoglycan-binding domain-containing protein [Deltaproteobacteria bacterium]|nr:LysM peptidoglycan-binding domain-containing protein [Deltaproteobacteria bacterium]
MVKGVNHEGTNSVTAAASQDAALPPGTTIYTVKKDDTLGKIARDHGLSLTALLKANPQFALKLLDGNVTRNAADPDYIVPGQKINVPPSTKKTGKGQAGGGEAPVDTLDASGAGAGKTEPGGDLVKPQNALAPGKAPVVAPDGKAPPAAETPKAAEAEKTAKDAAKTAKSPEDDNKANKVFGFLDKLLRNPIFQSVMAVVAAIPGIGEIASGVMVLLSLVNIIERWISTGKPPDVGAILSTLLYLGGVFQPGLGAFGGFSRVLYPGEPNDGPGRAKARAKATTDAEPQPLEPLSSDAYKAAAAAVDDGLKDFSKARTAEPFGNGLLELRGELIRLQMKEKQQGAGLDAEEHKRLAALKDVFTVQLPQAVYAEAARIAYGLEGANLQATPTPTAGRFYVVPEGGKLEALGEIEGLSPAPPNLLDAVRAYNGLGATDVVTPGTRLYVPTKEQVAHKPRPGVANETRMVTADSAAVREWLLRLSEAWARFQTEDAARANEILKALQGMGPAVVAMGSERGSDADGKGAPTPAPANP